ncbi:DUF3467 domain-containing protein [Thalassospira marina]|uniref:DUF3467 domain-containing protein n=1 Tax=Thalassospira marina TaxID=2048283 RepID=A0A2N3KMU9_9PROT|nr:DUF3467 domain-containing protein [Thalassospira marina]AUG55398.1 hypothetical protein CSC3H3_21220 [Thalassospira marina]PKR51793.1 hypothetical protein COO20_18260 [Thalassospira marina]
MAENTKPQTGVATDADQRKINWDDSNMRSTYANVSNVASTREEVMFLFGTSQVWSSSQDDVRVQLSDRIIMSPFAAKRLKKILDHTLAEYERVYGKLG